jgi:ferredoxin/flavodoxin---NADP+ reductase
LYEIVHREELAPSVTRMRVRAPEIARKRKAGQFVIVRTEELGERVPLTIADADIDEGTITLVTQAIGHATRHITELPVGDGIMDVVGPLGNPTHIDHFGTVLCIAGGIGAAPMYPMAQAMKAAGNKVITILGARNKDLMILEDDLGKVSERVIVMTDDGSHGEKGLVTDAFRGLLAAGETIDLVITVGPVIMMEKVCEITKETGIAAMASLNPIMIDGTGMCGGCRVEVGGEIKFACVDGPEFDGNLVDFANLRQRLAMYRGAEGDTLRAHEEECMLNAAK